MPSHKNILIFDFDGTIADTLQRLVEISNQICGEFHFNRIAPHEVEQLKDKTSQEITRHLKVPVMKIPQIAARARKELYRDISSIKIISGIKKILISLKSLDYKIGILTTNSLENVRAILERHNLSLFDFIHATPRVWGKSRSIKELINKNNFDTKKVLYIGDETRDIEAAKKAGVKIAAVTWGYNSRDILSAYNPDYLVSEPEELFDICTRS